MEVPTLAALEAALSSGALGAWLAAIPDAGVRAEVNQALALERRLVGEHPASLASCLLARLFDRAALAPLCDAWLAEMEACERPWLRPLRGLPASPGLLAELHDSAEARLTGLAWLRFVSNDEVALKAIRFHPSVQPPEERRRERLRWRWSTGEVRVEPDPGADAAPAPTWPRFEHPQRGPSYLQRGPDEGRLALPCPDEGTASASMTEDGRLFVYRQTPTDLHLSIRSDPAQPRWPTCSDLCAWARGKRRSTRADRSRNTGRSSHHRSTARRRTHS